MQKYLKNDNNQCVQIQLRQEFDLPELTKEYIFLESMLSVDEHLYTEG
jgi:hypothetical protein